MTQRTIIEMLSQTTLLEDGKTKQMFNDIIYKAFHNAHTEAEEKVIVAIALKYELKCFEEIMEILELEKHLTPFLIEDYK